MKKALMKDTIKEIKNTYRRFISILLMAFLGVGFFVGLRASSPDMLATIDKYFKDTNVFDIQVMSTLGLTDEDVTALEAVKNVEKVQGTYSQDAIINIDQVESVAKVLCVDEINKPVLIQGRMPETETECVVEKMLLQANNKEIGDKITVEMEDTTNDDGDKIPFLKNKELEIVGTVSSPLYISREKGTSNLGAGRVNYYIYVDNKNINSKDIYTQIYIKVKNSNQYVTSSTAYEDYISEVKASIENIKEEREQARHQMLVDKANEKVDEAQKTFDNEKANAESKIADAEKKIADGKAQIEKGEAEISKNKTQADTQFASAQKQIDNARAKLQAGEKELQTQEETINQMIAQGAQIDTSELEQKKAELQKSKAKLDDEQKTLNTQKNSATSQIRSAQKKLENSKSEIAEGEAELEKNKQEFNEKIADAEKELNDARNKIADIEEATWYVLDRTANQGYTSFINDTKSIESLGAVFPIVFFVIATLISLTSMTRMVEEQRTRVRNTKSIRI